MATPPLAIQTRPIVHDLLLAALPHPILVFNPENRIVYANPAAEAFMSASQAVLKRQTLGDVFPFGCPLCALVDQVRRTGATVNEYGLDIVLNRSETHARVDVFIGPLPEQPDSLVMMLQQRTMAQMIERQLTHRAAARSVSGMAAVLAHEIKNPLSGIRGAAQLLEPVVGSEDRMLTQLICTETDRIKNLVDRMEIFGDERPLVLEPVNIHAVLGHVSTLARTGFSKNIELVEEYDPSLPFVSGNRDKLIQAFLNLVKNAAEAFASPNTNSRIVLRTAFRPGVRMAVPGSTTRVGLPLMIEVEDNGPGISPDLRPHLFDPFVTTKTNGSGLGLALVAKIINDHGGIIECDSEPPRTVFRALLPMQSEPIKPRKQGT